MMLCQNTGSFKAINDEGMPIYGIPFMKSKLYVQSMDFLDSMMPGPIKALKAILHNGKYEGVHRYGA